MKTRPIKHIIDEVRIELNRLPEDHDKLIQLVNEIEAIVGSCQDCESNFIRARSDQLFCSDNCSARVRMRKYLTQKKNVNTEAINAT